MGGWLRGLAPNHKLIIMKQLYCPNCGGVLTTLSKIGLLPKGKEDKLICSMNMPYQGCGWRAS